MEKIKEKTKAFIEKWKFKLFKGWNELKFTLFTVFWYSIWLFFIIGFITSYSLGSFMFSIGLYLVYQMLLGDLQDWILQIKNN